MEIRTIPSILSSIIVGILYPYIYCYTVMGMKVIALCIEFIARLYVRYIL